MGGHLYMGWRVGMSQRGVREKGNIKLKVKRHNTQHSSHMGHTFSKLKKQ